MVDKGRFLLLVQVVEHLSGPYQALCQVQQIVGTNGGLCLACKVIAMTRPDISQHFHQ